jgi:uncharacterized protein (UPF0333 family)
MDELGFQIAQVSPEFALLFGTAVVTTVIVVGGKILAFFVKKDGTVTQSGWYSEL